MKKETFMKFTFDKDLMIKEISIAQEIISTKNAGSILSNVLLEAFNNTLTIKATDIKVNFETSIPVQIEEEGSTTIFCDKFMGILNTLPSGETEFNQISNGEDSSVSVEIKPISKKIKFQIKSISQENFPEVNFDENLSYFEVPSKDFKEMISQTSFAVSEDETRYFMNGVLFEKKGDNLNLVATDGRRLSFATKQILAGVNDFPSAIVHPKILNIIVKHAPEEGNINISIAEKMIFFSFSNYKFASVLLEGQFPNYERVIPAKQENKLVINKADFVEALKRISLMVDKKAGRMFFNISDGNLRITSQLSEFGSADEEIPCEYYGSSYVIALNYLYIEEPLRFINSDKIAFEFTEEMKAVTMKSEPESDYFHIIMPMQKE